MNIDSTYSTRWSIHLHQLITLDDDDDDDDDDDKKCDSDSCRLNFIR